MIIDVFVIFRLEENVEVKNMIVLVQKVKNHANQTIMNVCVVILISVKVININAFVIFLINITNVKVTHMIVFVVLMYLQNIVKYFHVRQNLIHVHVKFL